MSGRYKINLCIFLLFFLFFYSNCLSQTKAKTWTRLINKLSEEGFDKQYLTKVYSSKQISNFSNVTFKMKPRESKNIYKHFNKTSNIQKAQKFINDNYSVFESVEKEFNVDKSIIASIFLVETHFGSNTGKSTIINSLSRVSNIAEAANLRKNYQKLKKADPSITFQEVQKRAQYLEDLFYPELVALFQISKENNIDVLSIKGSKAGAFGIPQFLPTSYKRYGVDWNGDGKVSLFDVSDAIASCANYLAKSGWRRNIPKRLQEEVIWQYNRSSPYVNTVLNIFERLSVN